MACLQLLLRLLLPAQSRSNERIRCPSSPMGGDETEDCAVASSQMRADQGTEGWLSPAVMKRLEGGISCCELRSVVRSRRTACNLRNEVSIEYLFKGHDHYTPCRMRNRASDDEKQRRRATAFLAAGTGAGTGRSTKTIPKQHHEVCHCQRVCTQVSLHL